MSPQIVRKPVLTKIHEEHPVIAGDRSAVGTSPAAGATLQVPRGQVALNPVNPRLAFRSLPALKKILETLPLSDLETMKTDTGQLYACIVVTRQAFIRIYPEHATSIDDCPYVMLDGSRRRAAAEKFDLPLLSITINDDRAKDRASFRRDSAIANLGRAELNPYEEMLVLQGLVEETQRTWTEVGRDLGMTKGWVSQRRGLARLEPRLVTALTGDTAPKLSFETARRLATLDADEQWEAWQIELQRPAEGATEPGFTAVNPSPDPESSSEHVSTSDATEPTDTRKAGRPTRKITIMKNAEPEDIAGQLLEHFSKDKLRQILSLLDL